MTKSNPLRVLLLTALAGGVVLGLGWLVHFRVILDLRTDLTQQLSQAAVDQQRVLAESIDRVSTDVALLAGTLDLKDPSKMRAAILSFARSRENIYRVRIATSDGTEIVRVRRIATKSGSSYFRDTTPERGGTVKDEPWFVELFAAQPGDRPLYLGIEQPPSDESLPSRSVQILRLGAQIDEGGSARACIIVDVSLGPLLDAAAESGNVREATAFFAAGDGRWLRTAPGVPGGGLSLDSARPNDWRLISIGSEGSVDRPDGILAFSTVSFLGGILDGQPGAGRGVIKVIEWLPSSRLEALQKIAVVPLWWAVALAIGLVVPLTFLTLNVRQQRTHFMRARVKTNALLQNITERSADGIVAGEAVRDIHGDIRDFRVAFSNPSAAGYLRLVGRADSTPGGSERFPLHFVPDFFERCVQVVTTGKSFEIDCATESGPLGRRGFRIGVVKLDDGVVVTIAETTAQKQIVHDMRMAKEASENANRAKSQFLAMMGHEIRTPMNGLLGFAGLLEGTSLNPEQSEYVRTLRASGEALLRILEDILDYSHLEYEMIDLKSEPVRLGEVINQVARLFEIGAGEKPVEVVTRVDDSVPDTILGDGLRIRQVLVNLVANGVKFSERGYVLIHATVSEGLDEVVVHVVDGGPGIPPEMADRLFKPFSQVDSTFSRRYGGTGLGLSICKRLIETMGGEINVDSSPGKGSDFFFTLPIRRPVFQPADEKRGKAAHPGAVRHVLIVDDDPVNRRLIVRLVEKLGTHVLLAASGPEALTVFETEPIDLILMDVQMPLMDGLETTRRIRELEAALGRPFRTSICALTANSSPDDRARCLQAGMDDFIPKPVSVEQIERLLGRVHA